LRWLDAATSLTDLGAIRENRLEILREATEPAQHQEGKNYGA
jgi:hypothetical protein